MSSAIFRRPIKEDQLATIKYAEGLDAALYKMEWGRTQPDGVQIVVDQPRRFADYLDSALGHLYTAEHVPARRRMVEEAAAKRSTRAGAGIASWQP